MPSLNAVRSLRKTFVPLFVLAAVTALLILPTQMKLGAVAGKPGDAPSGRSVDNYDIRNDKSENAARAIERFRAESGKTAAQLADIREGFVRGEGRLRQRVPSLDVKYNSELRTPEVIGPDVWSDRPARLTGASNARRSEILRETIRSNGEMFGVGRRDADDLEIGADYANPDGNLAYARLEQRIKGVRVFRGEVTAGFTRQGEIIRINNGIAPGIDSGTVSTEFGDARSSVVEAYRFAGIEPDPNGLTINERESSSERLVFGSGDWATSAQKVYFPTEPGVVRPAWQVLIWQPNDSFYVIVDAASGTLLWRKNLAEDQTQAATYNVYANPNSYIKVDDSPAPLTPGPFDPTTGQQGAIIGRKNVTLIGNEGDLSFNNLGWIDDGRNITDGNALEAGIDRDGTNGVDAPATGDPYRVFNSTWNPPPGNPPPGDLPLTPQAQRGAVIQMFYTLNRWHDELYKRGFTEAARNFQHDNFGRGGTGNDRVSAEAQDSSGTNGANFATPPDGSRPRLQMTIWTGPDPDRDAAADAQVVLHEMTHGLSNRLHGNASGLGSNMARAMGEGWSDWYALTLLASADDDPNGIHAVGGYVTHLITTGFVANYYYGIRRFPQARIASVGPNGRPHNPLTFRYLNPDCNVLIGTTASNPPPSSAYPRGPIGVSQCDQVHNGGEVWSAALWEVRSIFIDRLGFNIGTRDVLQVVTDGMKLSPLSPTFLQARDAIIAAAAAISPQHAADVREGFRRRGMGFSAQVISVSPANVVEAFDQPNVAHVDPFTINDTPGNGDGNPTPGENVLLNIPVQNSTGNAVTNVSVSVNGGPAFSYGTVPNGQTVVNAIPYTIPVGPPCVFTRQFSIVVTSDLGTQPPVVRTVTLFPFPPPAFSNTTPIDLPAGQPTTTIGSAAPYPSQINVTGLIGNYRIRVRLNGFRHDWQEDVDLLLVGPGGHKFILMSDVGGSNTETIPARTFSITDSASASMPNTAFLDGAEYRPTNVATGDTFAPPAPAGPYANPSPAGSNTFASVFGMNGATMNGTWSLYGVDDATGDPGQITGGWTIIFEPLFADPLLCTPIPAGPGPDFDGDRRTDLSIFRPSAGEWWFQRSSDGTNSAAQFGTATDTIVPADYTGDGKTDMAFYRNGEWFVLRSGDFTYYSFPFGIATDITAPADYDGDAKADPAVFRPSTGDWYVFRSSDGVVSRTQFGSNGDRPVPADYDGDGRSDLAIFRPSNGEWWLNRSGTGVIAVTSGNSGDKTVQADYTGDGRADIAYFRPSTNEWFVIRTSDWSYFSVPFGSAGDIPVPGDYDGDGKADTAVFRPSESNWYIQRSTAGILVQQFGISTDKPVGSAYVR